MGGGAASMVEAKGSEDLAMVLNSIADEMREIRALLERQTDA